MLFTFSIVFVALLALCAVMAVGWAYQRAVANGGWTDVFWTFGTGGVLALACLCPLEGATAPTSREILVAILVAVWSLRLGSYILRRVRNHAEDARYANFRKDWGADFQSRMFWFLQSQAVAGGLLAIPILIAARNPAAGLLVTDFIGVALLIIGIAGEALADSQMHAFRTDPANKGKVCDTGLWSWSRHPNYFFEWLVWVAYPVIAIGGGQSFWWLALIGPLLMYYLLTRVSGIPPLELAMLASRGALYADYQRRVSAFFPLPPSKSSK